MRGCVRLRRVLRGRRSRESAYGGVLGVQIYAKMPAAAHSLSNEGRSSRLGRDAVRPGGVFFLRSRKRKSEIEVESVVFPGDREGEPKGDAEKSRDRESRWRANLAMI